MNEFERHCEATPVIDVLMPYFNGGRFVSAQVESIVGQTIGGVRLTILDNGSDSANAAALQTAIAGIGGIRIIRVDNNRGVVGGIELLLDAVEAPYFALSDADDVWDLDKLERSMAILMTRGADLVYTDLRMVDASGQEFFPSKWRYSNTPPLKGSCAIQLVLKNPVAGCTILGKKELLTRALPFPRGVPMHDRWLAIVAALGNGIAYVNGTTMSYRQHSSNDTGGLGFGLGALKQRIRRSGGNFRTYSRRRREQHKVLLDYIARHSQHHMERLSAAVMAKYLGYGVLGTLVASLPYALLVALLGRQLGIKNIGSDLLLSISAGFFDPSVDPIL